MGVQPIPIYALLDSESTNTFCSTGLLRKLGSRGQKTSLSLSTLESRGRQGGDGCPSARNLGPKRSKQGHRTSSVCNTIYIISIPVSKDSIVKPENLGRWEHLRDLEPPELSELAEVEMLIGQDCPEVIMPLEVRASEKGEVEPAPFAIKSLFGWPISGILGGTGRGSATSVRFISMTLKEKIEPFWKVEGAQLNSHGRGLSIEHQRAL